MQIEGTVDRVLKKDTVAGVMYDLVVNGETYGAGKGLPPCKEGDSVCFDVTYRGKYPNIARDTLEVVIGEPGKPREASKAPPGTTPQLSPPRPQTSVQDVISRQAASNAAIAWMQVLVAGNAIPITASAKPEARQAMLDSLLDRYRQDLLDYAMATVRPKPAASIAEDDEIAEAEAAEWN